MGILSSLFGPSAKKEARYYEVSREIDKQHNVMLQEFEDRRKLQEMNNEARRLFSDWLSSPEVEFDGKKMRLGILLIRPLCAYTIHDNDTAKYKSFDSRTYIIEQYNKIKEDYEFTL